MNESARADTGVHSIDLAQEADFALGSLRVRPARCEVESGGGRQTIQRRVMQVLVALADARGSVVSQAELVTRCWRGLSVSDDAIVRCIGILRKLAADYPDSPFEIETIAGVGYRLTSSSFGKDDVGEATAAPRRRFRIGSLAAVATVAILILASMAIWLGRGQPLASSARVTVMPFEALNASGNASSLVRSVPNEIVNQLGDSQIEAILAAGKDVHQGSGSASGLHVTGILRDDGHNTNVDVRIEDGPTHAALWATQFKRASNQTSDLPLEVAARVTDVVNMINFARGAKPPLTDLPALSALLQATDMIRDAHGGAWAQLLEHAQGIVARHPDFAFGHDVLAYAYVEAAENIDVPDRARAMSDAARREAMLTLELDPEDAGPYAMLAGMEPAYDYRDAEAIVMRGVKIATHPKGALGGLLSTESRLQENVGRLREALSSQLAAHATDPWGPPKTAKLAVNYANVGNMPAARQLIEKGIQLWPNHSGIRAKRQFIAGFYEQPSDALKILDSLDALASPDESNLVWRSFIKAKAAQSEQVTAATIPKLRQAADQGRISPEIEIMMLADLGATKEAMESADSAADTQRLEPWILFTPVTRNLRQDPGFVSLAGRLGLIKYWRETGKWPDFCSDPRSRSECSPQLLAALRS